MSTAARVVRNSGFLYIKMGITVLISLYTTRLVLSSLGAVDFGIFNLVGGAIAMLGFLNSTLANATQRFMSHALGAQDLGEQKLIFNISIVLHLLIGLVTVLLLLAMMWPLFGGILNIAPDRTGAAKTVYACLIGSTFLTIINVPYDAVMNAHENMLYYSVIGIVEALLKLGIAFCVVRSAGDRLILYGVLMALVPLLTLSVMKVYCHRRYPECVLRPRTWWDAGKAREILSFSGWNFLTAVSSLVTAQGLGIVLNHFFGALLNTAQAIAHQLNGYMSSFSVTMMKALSPVIVKRAGAGDYAAMNRVTVTGCKFSTLLIMLLAIPCIVEMPYLLGLWLKDVPAWAVLFCVLQLIQTMVVQSAHSVSTAVYATGNIRQYAIYKSVMNTAPLLLAALAFALGGGPAWLYIPMILVWGIGGNVVIVHFARLLCGLSVGDYLRGTVLPLLTVGGAMAGTGLLVRTFLPEGFPRLVLTAVVTTVSLVAATWTLGMDPAEKQTVRSLLAGALGSLRKRK